MSNLIKSSNYVTLHDKKIIEMLKKPKVSETKETQPFEKDERSILEYKMEKETQLEKKKILKAAEQQAQKLLETAQQEADQLKAEAELDINDWWNKRREEDQELTEKLKQDGYTHGLKEGEEKATQLVQEQYEQLLEEARQTVEDAYHKKEEILQSSEPFLLKVSTEIARKIIHQQLTIEPEWILTGIQKVLTKRREQGIITLCVSPQYYSYVEDYKDELLLLVDSQAELQIIPDQRVQDHGCIVRSSFGSIDARVETQLTEIKNALLQIAAESEEFHESESEH